MKKLGKRNTKGSTSCQVERDAVQVFCRLRPIPPELSCFRVISANTVAVLPSETAFNFNLTTLKETRYVFKHVFDANSTQPACHKMIAQPLVENMLCGKNGLLFAYGVTGSGKTHTMIGKVNDQGILPRCLDVLFKTIAEYQTEKFVFKPDHQNGFVVQKEEVAVRERQAALGRSTARKDNEMASREFNELAVADGVDEDNKYAVFISYVEVYNNNVYDLLENYRVPVTQPRNAAALTTRSIREDGNKKMYVHDVEEVEVKSRKEAIEVFQIGQKRKRVGHTLLNAQSSRSHSVFTIRLVQAPIDGQGAHILQDQRAIIVSQLSLVDLAGSERTNRTQNTGDRLRESSNINNSLMSLRTCLEVLRENQANGPTGMHRKVPYRDAKITHLFKSYFDGAGLVRMVVCINPHPDDYDESVQVMKFAEMTQEVMVPRPKPKKPEISLVPGRRKAAANQIRMAINTLESHHQTVNIPRHSLHVIPENVPNEIVQVISVKEAVPKSSHQITLGKPLGIIKSQKSKNIVERDLKENISDHGFKENGKVISYRDIDEKDSAIVDRGIITNRTVISDRSIKTNRTVISDRSIKEKNTVIGDHDGIEEKDQIFINHSFKDNDNIMIDQDFNENATAISEHGIKENDKIPFDRGFKEKDKIIIDRGGFKDTDAVVSLKTMIETRKSSSDLFLSLYPEKYVQVASVLSTADENLEPSVSVKGEERQSHLITTSHHSPTRVR